MKGFRIYRMSHINPTSSIQFLSFIATRLFGLKSLDNHYFVIKDESMSRISGLIEKSKLEKNEGKKFIK